MYSVSKHRQTDEEAAWIRAELRYMALGDARRTRRLGRLLEALVEQPAVSLPQACGSWAATKGAYRFVESVHVEAAAIRAGHARATAGRCAGHGRVLAIQDTTSLDWTHHPATRGLGYLEGVQRRGVKLHTVLAVSDAGVPLGLLHQAVWVRSPAAQGQRHQRRRRVQADKESQRWLTAAAATEAGLPASLAVVTLADAEADLYALLAQPRRAGHDLLIRASQRRRVLAAPGYLPQAVQQAPVALCWEVRLPRRPERAPRPARLQVRYATVTVCPPHTTSIGSGVTVQALWVEEIEPPPAEAGLTWYLLTTLPIDTPEQARTYVTWYLLRWLVERYHYTLKSGCQVEALQLESAANLQRALAVYSVVAWRLLWLTHQARAPAPVPCSVALSPAQWQALSARMLGLREAPAVAPSLQQAVRWIAQLGGFLGRKGDGEPGVKTLWRGWRRLHDIATTWAWLHPSTPPPTPDTRDVGKA